MSCPSNRAPSRSDRQPRRARARPHSDCGATSAYRDRTPGATRSRRRRIRPGSAQRPATNRHREFHRGPRIARALSPVRRARNRLRLTNSMTRSSGFDVPRRSFSAASRSAPRFGAALIEAGASRDDDVALSAFLNPAEQGEPFGGDLLVGENVFDARKTRLLGRKARPATSSLGVSWSSSWVRTLGQMTQSVCGISPCENRDEKRARRFDDMRKGHRTHAFTQRLQLARDRLRVGDDFQKFGARRFFHAMLSPKGERSSISPLPNSCGNSRPRQAALAYTSRPTASATARIRLTRSAKASGRSACSPSLRARSGSSWTSIMTASAPAATAASDICGT